MLWPVLFRPQSLFKLGSLGVAEGKALKFGSVGLRRVLLETDDHLSWHDLAVFRRGERRLVRRSVLCLGLHFRVELP
jgi:hypothetical protein